MSSFISNYMAQFSHLSDPTSTDAASLQTPGTSAPGGSSSSNFEPVDPVKVGAPTGGLGSTGGSTGSTLGSTLGSSIGSGLASGLQPSLLFAGFDWARVGTFIAGVICLLIGLFLLRPSTITTPLAVVGRAGKKVATAVGEHAAAAA